MTVVTGEASVSEATPAQVEPAPEESRTYAVLTQPDSIDAICGIVAAAASDGSAEGRSACSGAAERCRGNLDAVFGAGEAAPTLPGSDLEPLFGCPLRLPQLDACIAGALERGLAAYGASVGCDMADPPRIDTVALFASPECLAVALFCPDLVPAIVGGG